MSDRLKLSVLALLVVVFGVRAQLPVGTVKGTVERDGAALAGVSVDIESRAHSSYGATARTDDQGAFTFADAPVGAFVVKAHDDDGELLATSEGILEEPGGVVTLLLQVNR